MDLRLMDLESDMMCKYGFAKLPEDVESKNIEYIKSLIDKRLLENTKLNLYNIGGHQICSQFKRLIICGYGAYVEIPLAMLTERLVCDEPKYKKRKTLQNEDIQKPFVNYTIDDGWHTRIRLCCHFLPCGDFVPGAFYVNVGEVRICDGKIDDEADQQFAADQQLET